MLDLELSESAADEVQQQDGLSTPAAKIRPLSRAEAELSSDKQLFRELTVQPPNSTSNPDGTAAAWSSMNATYTPSRSHCTNVQVESVPSSPFPSSLQLLHSNAAAAENAQKELAAPFANFTKRMVSRSTAAVADESWSVFTVRRDLPSIGALHAELTALLQVLYKFILCPKAVTINYCMFLVL